MFWFHVVEVKKRMKTQINLSHYHIITLLPQTETHNTKQRNIIIMAGYRTRTNGNIPKALSLKFGEAATRAMCCHGVKPSVVIIPRGPARNERQHGFLPVSVSERAKVGLV